MKNLLSFCFFSATVSLLLTAVVANSQKQAAADETYSGFVNPPENARIMMRWWWFGPAVAKPELERELRVMKNAGIGGVEIQPVYPLELDDPASDFHNAQYLSNEFLGNIRFASETAKNLGLRVDITLGSGWPYGGPNTPVTEAAGRLRVERAAIHDGDDSVVIPPMEHGEKLIAAFLWPGSTQIKSTENGRVTLPKSVGEANEVLFFIASRTGQQVKRAAVGAEGFVLDHYSRTAIEHHLRTVADPLMTAFGDNPPHAVFSDSLEVFASDWTDDLLAEFQKRRGYNLTPCLPALIADIGPNTASIRHDWGETLTELADEHYLTPIRDWAHEHHTLFRSQTYGEPPVEMSANNLVDLPEGEHGPEWRAFSPARWASSASHLYGRPITSTETWTWLHAPSFRATPLDMKAEADLHFLEGINQLIGHGWPYSPPSAGEPGWRFYASAAFNDHNPWFQVMPDIAKYLQRLSYLMRQGSPANDVAIYLPTHDAWAQFDAGSLNGLSLRPAEVSIDQRMDRLIGPKVIPQILNAGYNFDFIDDKAIASIGAPYKVLIVPGAERMPIETLDRLAEFQGKGGILIATRRLPSLAPGFKDQPESAQVESKARELFKVFVPDEDSLGSVLHQRLTPDFAVQSQNDVIGFVHRKLNGRDIYFVVNTSNKTVSTSAQIRVAGVAGEWWDPFSGASGKLGGTSGDKSTTIQLNLLPYESQVLVFRRGKLGKTFFKGLGGVAIDLNSNWKVTFDGLKRTIDMPQLTSWTDVPETRFYSGTATYTKTVDVTRRMLKGDIQIDFGNGESVPMTALANGMRAWIESPIRESALVYVNNQLAGSVWHPPYALKIRKYLRAGSNELRIVVANLAINEMAGQALPDYRLLKDRYGDRFQPQGFENFHALPAGILGPVHLFFDQQ